MASSSTEICNFALGLVGEKRISDIDEDSSEDAKLCKLHYEQTLDEELRSYMWNAAEAQQELAQDPNAKPILDYEHAYLLPNDPFCLRVLEVNDGLERYRVSGRHLLTDCAIVLLRFTKRITNIAEMDSLMVKTLYTQLAIKIVYPLTQDARRETSLITQYQTLVEPLAKFIDSTENNDSHPIRSGFIESRGSQRGAGNTGGTWA